MEDRANGRPGEWKTGRREDQKGAGTVYLCHPFLVHAAQPHRGTTPKFMAQPPLLPKRAFDLSRPAEEQVPVERAISLATGA